MKFKVFFTLSIFFIMNITLVASQQFVIRFDNPSQAIVRQFTSNDYDVASFRPGEYLDIVVNDEEYMRIVDLGYRVTITQTEEQLVQNLHTLGDLDGYRDYEDLLADLQQYELDYPNICKLYDIGDSRGKEYSLGGNANYDDFVHEIWALKVSDNVEDEEDEPCIYYFAEHHAREPISLEVTMNILDHILQNYGTDPTITENIDNQQVWFVPLVNPDGHKVVTDEQNTMWRKNIRDNDENGMINVTGYSASDGVDPNRNYGWHWGGASTNWISETYQGPIPFSEPELQAVRDLMEQHHFIAGVSYHSYGELVLYPYGYEDGIIAPDQVALSELANDIAYSIPGQYGGFYNPQASWALYPCTGTTDDYAYGMYGIFGYTIELATEFIPPANQVDEICSDNLEAGLILLDRSSHSILQGHITDDSTNQPLQAEIFVDGIDNTGVYRNVYISDQAFGSYYRLLTDGNYDVTFTAYGYESQTFEDVAIIDTAPTILDVALTSANPTSSVFGIITDAGTGLPIENATVELMEYGIPSVTTNALGEYEISGIYSYTYNIGVYAEGYVCHLEDVAISGQSSYDFMICQLDDGTFENGQIGNCWIQSGHSDWAIEASQAYEGILSIRSGSINDDQHSTIQTSVYVSSNDEISFARKVSSEEDYDYLRFYIDEELIDQWSGNEDWLVESYQVTSGIHTFTWSYVKDGGVSTGSDCSWLDNISIPMGTFLEPPSSLTYSIPYPQSGDLWSVILNWAEPQNSNFLGYNVYRNSEILNTTLVTDEEFTDSVPYGSCQEYYVTAVYDEGESSASNFLNIEEGDWPLSNGNNLVTYVNAFYGNYPNPFNPSTTFKFSLAATAVVELQIYNLKGQLIRTLVDEELEPGFHDVTWHGDDNNGKQAASGIYFVRIDSDSNENIDYTSVKKIILLK
jgi:hypothetical protein